MEIHVTSLDVLDLWFAHTKREITLYVHGPVDYKIKARTHGGGNHVLDVQIPFPTGDYRHLSELDAWITKSCYGSNSGNQRRMCSEDVLLFLREELWRDYSWLPARLRPARVLDRLSDFRHKRLLERRRRVQSIQE